MKQTCKNFNKFADESIDVKVIGKSKNYRF